MRVIKFFILHFYKDALLFKVVLHILYSMLYAVNTGVDFE